MNAIRRPTAHGFFCPTKYFLVAGEGDSSESLVAFDCALLNSGVGDLNLIKLSSIVGPGCVRTEPLTLTPGSLVAVAFASMTDDKPGRTIASGVAVAHPTDSTRAALVMEHSDFASKKEVEDKVIRMAIEGIRNRGLEVAHVESIAIEHIVRVVGATFAAVVEV